MGISGSQKALEYALSAVGRSGATRFGYTSPGLFLAINGTQYATARPVNGNVALYDADLAINEVLHETANTAAFAMKGVEPSEGSDVVITLGSINNLERLYAGTILNRTHQYVDTPANWNAPINVIDYTWLMTRRKVSGLFTNVSATTIANAIIAQVPGVTSAVASGLPVLNSFSYTNISALAALSALAKRIGGYCDVDYHKRVKLFITDTSVSNPIPLTSAHLSLDQFAYTRDLSQVVTRIFVIGAGGTAASSVSPGDTVIPLDTVGWNNPLGGTVQINQQRVTYTGLQVGGSGTLVGLGTGPTSAPAAVVSASTGLSSGVYQYAYTDLTAAGESLPSPPVSVTVGGNIADPSVGPNGGLTNGGTGGPYPFASGDHARLWAYTFVTAGGESLPSPMVSLGTDPLGGGGPFYAIVNTISIGPASTTARNIYRTVAGGSQLKYVGQIADNVTTSFDDHITDGSLGANVPTSSTASAGNRVSLSSVATGPSTPVAVTSRKIYRTVVNGSQLKLVTTLADNVTTVYVDSTADGSLGANAPTSDASGLAQPSGQVLAGATSLLVAGTGNFTSTGGWAFIGNGQQVIRYTGFSGNSLSGIPASGLGSITAAVAYNSTVTAAPALMGIASSGPGSIQDAITTGDQVNLVVQCDDLVAQATLAALLGNGDDGIVEDTITDGTIGETEARAQGAAQLALCSTALVSITYTSRDPNTHAGRSIVVDLGSPTSVTATFLIQQVTINTFQPALFPTYTVQASSARFSLEDLLRLALQAATS